MPDQADILRHLVAGAIRRRALPKTESPPLLAVAGAKGGVGTTTVATNLSIALANGGQRVLLADVNFCRADVALHCDLKPRHTTRDILAGRRDIHETLIAGPEGIQVSAGAWASPDSQAIRPAAQQRLIDQLQRLGNHVDLIVLDIGCDTGETAQRYWQAADHVLLITTADSVAVMDAYAAVKIAGANCAQPNIHIIVNQLGSEDDPADVHARIDRSCQRFLDLRVALAGSIPVDHNVPAAAAARTPLATFAPQYPAATSNTKIAAELTQWSTMQTNQLATA